MGEGSQDSATGWLPLAGLEATWPPTSDCLREGPLLPTSDGLFEAAWLPTSDGLLVSAWPPTSDGLREGALLLPTSDCLREGR